MSDFFEWEAKLAAQKPQIRNAVIIPNPVNIDQL